MVLKYDVYIAGGMHGRMGLEVIKERMNARQICNKLGLKPYDPSLDESINGDRVIDDKPRLRQMRKFVEKDFKNLDQCRAILVLTGDRSSAGTAWEMARMYFKYRRPIVLVAPLMADGQLTNFTTILADKICKTQIQALQWLKRRLQNRG